MAKDLAEIGAKLEDLDRKLERFEAFEEKVDKVVAENLQELRFLCYALLVMLAIIFFFFAGTALKQLGF
ncbi:MAG: hypothetical protein AB1626_04295 [Candidatus Micrarchaeota archaeon]